MLLYILFLEFCPEHDVECQRSITQVIVAWEEFNDEETEVVK